jgi:hypothetical protein
VKSADWFSVVLLDIMADKKAILLRIPPDLCEQLNRWARDELRSVNGQIEFILREAVRKRSGGRGGREADDSGASDEANASPNP